MKNIAYIRTRSSEFANLLETVFGTKHLWLDSKARTTNKVLHAIVESKNFRDCEKAYTGNYKAKYKSCFEAIFNPQYEKIVISGKKEYPDLNTIRENSRTYLKDLLTDSLDSTNSCSEPKNNIPFFKSIDVYCNNQDMYEVLFYELENKLEEKFHTEEQLNLCKIALKKFNLCDYIDCYIKKLDPKIDIYHEAAYCVDTLSLDELKKLYLEFLDTIFNREGVEVNNASDYANTDFSLKRKEARDLACFYIICNHISDIGIKFYAKRYRFLPELKHLYNNPEFKKNVLFTISYSHIFYKYYKLKPKFQLDLSFVKNLFHADGGVRYLCQQNTHNKSDYTVLYNLLETAIKIVLENNAGISYNTLIEYYNHAIKSYNNFWNNEKDLKSHPNKNPLELHSLFIEYLITLNTAIDLYPFRVKANLFEDLSRFNQLFCKSEEYKNNYVKINSHDVIYNTKIISSNLVQPKYNVKIKANSNDGELSTSIYIPNLVYIFTQQNEEKIRECHKELELFSI